MSKNTDAAIQNFFAEWTDKTGMKALCFALYAHMAACPGLRLEFVARPGVSYSIRMLGKGPEDVAALLDIIDDDPEDRWLSLCFYADLVTDPEELGDVVPGGLAGEDARCFDVDAPEGMENFLLERLREAHGTIAKTR